MPTYPAIIDLRDARAYAHSRPAGAVRLSRQDVRERAYLLPPRHRRVVLVGGSVTDAKPVLAALRLAGRNVEHLPHETWRDAMREESGTPTRTRLWEPATVVERATQYLEARPVRTALDLACGSGRNAVYLAEHGFDVTAIDRDSEALARARDLAARHGVTLHTQPRDLERPGALEGLRADLVVVVRFLDRSLFSALPSVLAPGGLLAYETFTVDQAARGHPRQARFLLQAQELRGAFPGLQCLEYEEDAFDEAHLARLIARRPV